MTKLLAVALLMVLSYKAIAQKKEIDYDSVKNWGGLEDYGISPDGHFTYYSYQKNGKDTLALVSTANSLIKQFSGARNPAFSSKGDIFYFLSSEGLVSYDLLSGKTTLSAGVDDYELITMQNNHLIIKKKGDKLTLSNSTGKILAEYDNVTKYAYKGNGNVLVVNFNNVIHITNLRTLKYLKIDVKGSIGDFYFNEVGNRMFFFDSNGKKVVLFYCEMEPLKSRAIDLNNILDTNKYELQARYGSFGRGSCVLLRVQEIKKHINPDPQIITNQLDVWTFNDKQFQPGQLLARSETTSYQISFNVSNYKVIQLEDSVWTMSGGVSSGKYVLQMTRGRQDDAYFNKALARHYRLMSMDTYKTIDLNNVSKPTNLRLSDKGSYLTWSDNNNFFCREISTGINRCLTSGIDMMTDFSGSGRINGAKFEILGWIKDEKALLIRDRYDIWMLDPRGSKQAVNITHHYG